MRRIGHVDAHRLFFGPVENLWMHLERGEAGRSRTVRITSAESISSPSTTVPSPSAVDAGRATSHCTPCMHQYSWPIASTKAAMAVPKATNGSTSGSSMVC